MYGLKKTRKKRGYEYLKLKIQNGEEVLNVFVIIKRLPSLGRRKRRNRMEI